MLNVSKAMTADAVKGYFQAGDYWIDGYNPPGVWGGELSKAFGLSGQIERDAFNRMADGLDPVSGEKLSPGTKEDRRSANDITISAPKPVTLLYVRTGDERILQAFNDSCDEIMGIMEREAAARVRIGGANEDRTTGNWSWAGFVHFEARPDAHSQLPDPQLHRHHVTFNLTNDPVEERVKALQIGFVKSNADLYMPMFHNILAGKMRELGYGIERTGKVGFGITGISRELVERFSRRRLTIEHAKEDIARANDISDPERLRRLSAELGVLTRLHKQKDLTKEQLWKSWDDRMTRADKDMLDRAQGQRGRETTEAEAVQYALSHLFERKSVVPEKKIVADTLSYGVGSVDVDAIRKEMTRQGVLVKGSEATTRDVLEQEGRIIAFAREGRGTMRPLARGDSRVDEARLERNQLSNLREFDLATLSAEQQALCRHVWESSDRVVLIEGDAGTGKTHTMKAAIAGIDRPVEVLAPSSDASRGVLRREGFKDADTVASFLASKERQNKTRGGVIWVDEAGQLSMNDLERVFTVASQQQARVILQGDRKQHDAVSRGSVLHVLERYAGLPVARLKEIRRQTHKDYRDAVKAIAKGDISDGYDILSGLGWVKQVDSNKPLVDDYVAALDRGKSALVVAPTHQEKDEITAEIRDRLKQEGKLGNEERTFQTLVPLGWTEAEKGDRDRYDGSEVLQFHRNSGAFKAGGRVAAADWLATENHGNPSHMSVYTPQRIELAAGDTIRITSNDWDVVRGRDGVAKRGRHRLNNGSQYTVKGFRGDDIELSNGWLINTPHVTHGYVTTSHASQGKTVDRVLIAMGSESAPAINAQQFYVSASRGRESATIYSDMPANALREVIQRSDVRKSATELMGVRKRPKRQKFMQRVRQAYEQIRDRAMEVLHERQERAMDERQREIAYER